MKLADESATEALGAALARALPEGCAAPLVLYLDGELGAGKTTLARGLLRALGVTGTIRSPSYTLVEPYDTPRVSVLHADLYRLQNSAEVPDLGLDELPLRGLLLVEWPERGQPQLPAADLVVHLAHDGTTRSARLQPVSAAGKCWLSGEKCLEIDTADH
jgi:tRNA threonylcarbamoyladenosine biosynthesis protein TsaE